MPLLRNSVYRPERLNSAENYYGYNARRDLQPSDDLLVSSAWIAKMSGTVKCSLKLANLVYIVRTCDVLNAPTCEGLYLGADGKSTIRGTKINIHDLAIILTVLLIQGKQDIPAEVVAVLAEGGDLSSIANTYREQLQTLTGGDSDVAARLAAMAANKVMEPLVDNRKPFCESLYTAPTTTATDEKTLLADTSLDTNAKAKIALRWAIEKLDFYLASEYRTAYLVQQNRICPVKRQWICDRSEVYKYHFPTNVTPFDPCTDGVTPDQVRIYPFKVPDLFTNKNFCNTADLEYPGLALDDVSCKSSEYFSYADSFQEYYDPALLNKNFLLTSSQMKSYRDKIIAKRSERAQNASKACTANSIKTYPMQEADLTCSKIHTVSNDLLDCENCQGKDVKAAIVKVINQAIDNGTLYNLENPNGNSAGTDNITDGMNSSQITTSAYNSLEAPMNDYKRFNDFCLYRVTHFIWIPFFAYADIDYFVVTPFSDEVETIENTLIATQFKPDTYKKFITDDRRQNRKLQVNNVDSHLGNIPVWLPAAGPIGSVLIQQEGLYSQSSPLHQSFKDCSSAPSYFETRCAQESAPNVTFEDNSACITNVEGRCTQGCSRAGIEKIVYESAEDGGKDVTCSCNQSTSEEDGYTQKEFHYHCAPVE